MDGASRESRDSQDLALSSNLLVAIRPHLEVGVRPSRLARRNTMSKSKRASAQSVSLSVKNKVTNVQNRLCEASFIVYFLRGMLDRAASNGTAFELPQHESAGFIHILDDLVTRLEAMLSDLEDVEVGHE
jgi:hypothetical protein